MAGAPIPDVTDAPTEASARPSTHLRIHTTPDPYSPDRSRRVAARYRDGAAIGQARSDPVGQDRQMLREESPFRSEILRKPAINEI
ncbi:hypothetical protein [Sphingomonas sp. 2378]|uniref:hypothetical protein n=1 Tax=Sphingomonas sp. 2378 TaxID=1219748 RepID=UPI00311ADABF